MAEKERGGIDGEPRPLVEEIPGRSALETDPSLAEMQWERQENENGDPKLETYKDTEGRTVAEKRWDYHRAQFDGEWKDSQELKSVSQRRLEYGDKRHPTKPTKEIGKHLAREHAWENNYEYDEDGNCTRFFGENTEGEKKGEQWDETKTYEQINGHVKVASVNRAEKPVSSHAERPGESEPVITVKVEYRAPDKQSVYGKKMTLGKPETAHGWGELPEGLPDINLESIKA
ncbi:MAG: hypothetical protein Q8Q20_04355 [bacterium]|nr:hypothetical protein [bacterium]